VDIVGLTVGAGMVKRFCAPTRSLPTAAVRSSSHRPRAATRATLPELFHHTLHQHHQRDWRPQGVVNHL